MRPLIIEDSISIAANTPGFAVIVANSSLRNLLNVPFPAKGKLLAVGPTTGLRLDLTVGGRQVCSLCEPEVATSVQDPLQVINDDFYANEGDLIALEATNPTGGALTLRYRLQFDPVVTEETWAPGMEFDVFAQGFTDTLVMQRGPIAVANATNDQQLMDGTKFSRMQVPGILRVLMTQSAIGMLRQLLIETDRISPPSTFPITNRIPQDPFDSTIEGIEVPKGELQMLQVSNNSGGSLNVFWKTKFKKLAP